MIDPRDAVGLELDQIPACDELGSYEDMPLEQLMVIAQWDEAAMQEVDRRFPATPTRTARFDYELRVLPDNYRPALAPDVPEGRACGNCNFYNEEKVEGDKAYCEKWDAYVSGAYYCNAWEPHEVDDEVDDDSEDEDAEGDDRAAKFNYDARHLAGSHDQSTHGKGGGGSGLGVYVPGQRRPGAGDGTPFPKKGTRAYDDFMAGSAGQHVRTGPDGEILGWTPERQALHDKIVAEHVLGVKPVDGQAEFVMMGGGSGAGKTTVLRKGGSEELPTDPKGSHVMINADEIKTGADGKTGIPEFRERVMGTDQVAGKGAAAFVHEESAFLAQRVQAAAIERNQNILLDGTGDSGVGKLAAKVDVARQNGYSTKGVYVTIPTDMAVSRVASRGAKPALPGANFGRVVPEAVTRDIHISVSRVFPEAVNSKVFDVVELWDNTTTPKLVYASKRGGVLDAGLWDAFTAKGNEPLSSE
jgi:predicted ABC-type ATPase